MEFWKNVQRTRWERDFSRRDWEATSRILALINHEITIAARELCDTQIIIEQQKLHHF